LTVVSSRFSNAANPIGKPNLPQAPVSQSQTAALDQFRSKRAANPEKPMKSRASKALLGAVLALAFLTAGIVIGIGTSVQAQTAPPPGSASMANPPVASSAPNANGARSYNLDNMPTKRPALPPNSDRMLHNSPASDAIAK
jgi:hypothetical protein